jgi:hypothetical protein
MIKDNNDILEILAYNKGFDEPEKWLRYAKDHNFSKVSAKK